MDGDALCRMPATEIARLTRTGAVSAVEVVDAVIARIERLEPAVNAYALVDADGARAAARAADAARARGEALGPLHGVPFSVKDMIATAGMETAYGSHLMAGNIPDRDAVAVARVKAAGGILLGKTTTPEFAHKALTDSPRHGHTRNPWNLSRSPGGSSGGAAAAIASGMGPVGITTDGAGSSRIPASCCGILGIKATLGYVPNEQAVDLFGTFTFLGTMARTAADLALMLESMAGPEPGDPWSRCVRPGPLRIDDDPSRLMKGLRVLYLPFIGNELLDSGVGSALDAGLARLGAAGADLRRGDGREEWGYEAARVLIRAPMSPRMARFSAADRERMDRSMRAALAETAELTAHQVAQAALDRTLLYRKVEALLETADVIVTPTVAAPPPAFDHYALDPITIDGQEAGIIRKAWYCYPAPFNLTGHPAISIPCGRSDDGMPVGMQVIGPWFAEQRLIDVAAAMERLLPWAEAWPPLAG